MTAADTIADSLRREYPGWRITEHHIGESQTHWTATLIDERAGWYPTLVRPTLGDLGEALAGQRNMRAARVGR